MTDILTRLALEPDAPTPVTARRVRAWALVYTAGNGARRVRLYPRKLAQRLAERLDRAGRDAYATETSSYLSVAELAGLVRRGYRPDGSRSDPDPTSRGPTTGGGS